MPKLTLTSTFASSITIGDPGVLAFNLAPKETKSVEATETQLRQLTPGLDKLKAAGWINYTVVEATSAAPVKIVETVKVETKPIEPPAPVPPPEPVLSEPVPEPVTEKPVEAVTPAETPEAEAAPASAPAPSTPRPPTFDRKNRNR